MDNISEKYHELKSLITRLEDQNKTQFESINELKNTIKEEPVKFHQLEVKITNLDNSVVTLKDKLKEALIVIQQIVNTQQDHTSKVLELQTIYRTIKTFGYLIISFLGLFLTLNSILNLIK
jgi:chromosome segregation ATPase